MICPKCSFENSEGSSFCIKCGLNLNAAISQGNNSQTNPQTMVQQNNQQKFEEVKKTAVHYFKYSKDVLLNPYKTFKNKEQELSNTKNALIFSGIVSLVMMLITLLTNMISSIFVKEISAKTFKYHTVVKFSELGDLNYLTLIGRNLLIYAGIIVVMALVYYIVGLIFKKDSKFTKLLSISATSVIPFIALGMIISPIVNLIWQPLSLVATVAGLVYSILIFINLIKEEIKFEDKDLKIKFHLICLTILGTIGYYLYTKLFMSVIGSEINDFLNMFK